jgi:hypothetical protein
MITQYGIEEGEDSAVLENRRMAIAKGRSEAYVPMQRTATKELIEFAQKIIHGAFPDCDGATFECIGDYVEFMWLGVKIAFVEGTKPNEGKLYISMDRVLRGQPGIKWKDPMSYGSFVEYVRSEHLKCFKKEPPYNNK